MVTSHGVRSVSSVEEIRSAIRYCLDGNLGILPVGGGTRIHIANPAIKDLYPIKTDQLTQTVEYNPDDLVIVTEAGKTLSSLQEELRQNGQWLPIEVAHPDVQTLGGIVASRTNSSLRPGFGSVRDWLIGVEAINADAEIVVGGGKVVKNVSGYDLPKLYCGSWGTLGFLTKVNFKVSPLPEADRSILAILSSDRNAEQLIEQILAKYDPSMAILFNARAAHRLLGSGSEPAQHLYVRFLGQQEDVDALIESIGAVVAPFSSSVVALPPAIAIRLNELLTDFPHIQAPLTATYHILSSQVGAHVRMVEWIAEKSALAAEITADTSCGIVNAHFFPVGDNADWLGFMPVFADKAQRVGGSLIVERMPETWREANFPVWSPLLADFPLMKLIKQSLDPHNLFCPGRFIGGI